MEPALNLIIIETWNVTRVIKQARSVIRVVYMNVIVNHVKIVVVS